MPSQTEESKALLRRITEEIWNKGRLDLMDELISDDLATMERSARVRIYVGCPR